MTVSSVTVSVSTLSRLRTLWWAIHRWIALVLCVLLVPIAISGALLVWHDEFEPLLHPARFAVSGNGTTAISSYLDNARGALPANFTPMAVANRPTPRTTFSRKRSGRRSPRTVPRRPPMSTVAALRRVPERAVTRVRSMRSR